MATTLTSFTETAILRADFYVTGGTLRPDAPSYVERQADKDLCRGLSNGEFCYVLTPRQMGKSSLMVRTVKRLREDGVAVAVLDLTAIGQNLTIEQWYDGLISRLGQQFDLEDELTEYWETHPEFGPLQRWLTSIEKVVLERIPGRVVIFVDEIDIVRSLPFSTDEFFAAIREAYNRRSREPAFARLAFGLLGVATPTDLIRDTRMTPFNIGHRIELNDFTEEEAAPLAKGLGPNESESRALLRRVLFWTGGHPYLTQRICRALADRLERASVEAPPPIQPRPPVIPTASTVDRLVEKLFLSRQARDRDDNLIFVRERILRSEVDVAGLLYLYRKILSEMHVPDDETNPLVSVLRLSGITRGLHGELRVRNRIYARVFDDDWIRTNMPEAEVRRQRGARRKGVLLGLSIAVAVLLIYLLAWPLIRNYRQQRLAQKTAEQVQRGYRMLTSYRDNFETTVEIGVGGSTVPVKGSGSILYHRPGMFNLVVKSDFSTAETEVRLSCDAHNLLVDAPTLRQFTVGPAPPPPLIFTLPPPLAEHMGPVRILPVYRLFLEPGAMDRFLRDAHNIHYLEGSEMDGQRVRVLLWEHSADALLGGLGLTNQALDKLRVPVTAWISVAEDKVMQIRLDLSLWAKELVGNAPDANITTLMLTEAHKGIESSVMPVKPLRIHFAPPGGSQPVREFTVPSHDIATLAFLKRQFSRMIPTRFPAAPANLIDLTEYYNAPLSKTWHPGLPDNSLEFLPTGIIQFGPAYFDVRGVVQLSGKKLEEAGGHYPRTVTGIKIGQSCRQLHFLQATGWTARDGTRLGSYIVHYEDGQEQVIPIVYGVDVRDWSERSDPSVSLRRGNIAWNAINAAGVHVRLFRTQWVNPLPDVPIATIDYVSAMADSAPFLIALTAEP